MRVYRLPKILRFVYPGASFNVPGVAKTLYLTFDDGPTPGITDYILDLLESRGVKSTFFVSGVNVSENYELFNMLSLRGHSIGNHGYLHINGFRQNKKSYMENVDKGAEISGSGIFRPPYGKITPAQYRSVRKKYHVVFWSLIPYDFDTSLSPDHILDTLKRGIRPGSIIVLHDNKKSRSPEILDEFIHYSLAAGYNFDTLENLNPIR